MAFTDHQAFNAMNHLATESDKMSREMVDSTIQSIVDFIRIMEVETNDPLKLKKNAEKYIRDGKLRNQDDFLIHEHFKGFEWYNNMIPSMNQEEYRKMYSPDGTITLAPEGKAGLRPGTQSKGRVLDYLMDEIHNTLIDAGIDIHSYKPPTENAYSLRRVEGGWTFTLDDEMYQKSGDGGRYQSGRYHSLKDIIHRGYMATGEIEEVDTGFRIQSWKTKFGY